MPIHSRETDPDPDPDDNSAPVFALGLHRERSLVSFSCESGRHVCLHGFGCLNVSLWFQGSSRSPLRPSGTVWGRRSEEVQASTCTRSSSGRGGLPQDMRELRSL